MSTKPEVNAQREGDKEFAADSKGVIFEFLWWMKKQGYAEATIEGDVKLIEVLVKRGANLYDPESIKEVIAKQSWSTGRKANAVNAYNNFLKMRGGKWTPPTYEVVNKIPFIPTENELDQLIAAVTTKIATFLLLLKETGIRSGEAWTLKWTDLDTATGTIRITPEKGSNPRICKLSQKLLAMLECYPRKYGQKIFGNPSNSLDNFRDDYAFQRKKVAHKLKNPRINQITFHTFRHWKATMEYHKTKDILHVKQILGHKSTENTERYISLAETLFKNETEYISKVAKTTNEACILIEAGFDYVCEIDGNKLFRKRKF
ncbi:MAG: site-specific integrase [Candidatus Bathyarchaeota archaeon]|nr:site-specific integrase [Candidatus Bathyarchaeota archaeon]